MPNLAFPPPDRFAVLRYPVVWALAALFAVSGAHASGQTGNPAPAAGRVRLTGGPLITALAIPAPLAFGEFRWSEADVPGGRVTIDVFPALQIISVARAGHEIGTAVILYGLPGKPTPRGTFRIKAKWADHRSSTYGTDMPYTLRLTDDGVSIHAVDVRPGSATYGCVGVPLAFARRLFALASLGTPVTVH